MANRLKRFRESQLISKTELSRKSGLSVVTIDRIEQGYDCRMATKRKILTALSLKTEERTVIFDEEGQPEEK